MQNTFASLTNGVKPGRKMAGEFSFYRACIKPSTAGHHDVGSGMEDLSREKMACKQLDEDTCPSVCFCTVNQEAININLKSNGLVH